MEIFQTTRGKKHLAASIIALILLLMAVSNCAFAVQTLQEKLQSKPLRQLAADVMKFGDAKRGALAFLKPELNCVRCHSLEDSQRKLGPDLTKKRRVTAMHLAESVLNPSKVIHEGYETAIVQMLDGELLTGVIVEEKVGALVMDRIEEPDRPMVVDKEEIDQWRKSDKSTMPEGLANQLTSRREFLDLVRFLQELAVIGPDAVSGLMPNYSMYDVAPLPEYEKDIDHVSLIRGLGRDAFMRGEELFRLRCASCHGTVEEEGSMPTSLRFASGKFKRGSDPLSMYQTLTHGFGMMNAQRWMVPKQKYDVIHYIRQHFLKEHNTVAYSKVDRKYLDNLPVGSSLGPEPVLSRPWTTMDYGPSLNNTIEVSSDGSNIAQKGIAIRLDSGPGGVESGKHWMMYDHDTMRVAGVWNGEFVDYNGIHFNGVHGQHPTIAGSVVLSNPVGPGFGRPADASFSDDRIVGRDGRKYGPLPQSWLKYKGMYRFAAKTILNYQIGSAEIFESPALAFADGKVVYQRQFNVSRRDDDLMIQIFSSENLPMVSGETESKTLVFARIAERDAREHSRNEAGAFDGRQFLQLDRERDIDMTDSDFTIYAEIKTEEDGTIFCQTKDQEEWVADGQSFFVRDGRLQFDIGWVGAAESQVRVDDGRWHKVAMTWKTKSGDIEFYVDGELESAGRLRQRSRLADPAYRIGFTNKDFPPRSGFEGEIRNVRFFSKRLSVDELSSIETSADGLKFSVLEPVRDGQSDRADKANRANRGKWVTISDRLPKNDEAVDKIVHVSLGEGKFQWIHQDGNLRLHVPAGEQPLSFSVSVSPGKAKDVSKWVDELGDGEIDLSQFTSGGPANWPHVLATDVEVVQAGGPYEVDVFTRPTTNPWNDRLRLTGVDFVAEKDEAIVCCWDGTVYQVSGIGSRAEPDSQIFWKRIAAGLFQPLGVRIVNDQIYVSCRDQIVRLHDLNDDGEMDWYENFNSDHQVTEHFHEFAMGLQTDEAGNFYYAKSARHALKAVVPHHGTLLRVSADGAATEIVANGFRAANGVCLNPDGTFFVTDQEGHWNPKNRINWVEQGGFYGNMFGYHDVTDESNEAMDPPLCWITNAFDRSPGELLWVDSNRWGPLSGRLLNLSYGMGQLFVVPHEKLNGQWQGGMCAFPLENFPTGIMRGRFSPKDGQLYCCGMFAWAGNQHQPGGFYRIRYTGQPVHLPVAIRARSGQLEIEFSGLIDANSIAKSAGFQIQAWDLKRTKNYGSRHYNEREWEVENIELAEDGRTVRLTVPDLSPTWCMSIDYSLLSDRGDRFDGIIHSTIHQIGGDAAKDR